MSTDVTKKSAEDVGDKVSLSGKRFETGFKRKRGALLLRSGSQRKRSFQLKRLTNPTHRIGYSRLFGWKHLGARVFLISLLQAAALLMCLCHRVRPGLTEASCHSLEVSSLQSDLPRQSLSVFKSRGHFSFCSASGWVMKVEREL